MGAGTPDPAGLCVHLGGVGIWKEFVAGAHERAGWQPAVLVVTATETQE